LKSVRVLTHSPDGVCEKPGGQGVVAIILIFQWIMLKCLLKNWKWVIISIVASNLKDHEIVLFKTRVFYILATNIKIIENFNWFDN
jgi:hypothetical protein